LGWINELTLVVAEGDGCRSPPPRPCCISRLCAREPGLGHSPTTERSGPVARRTAFAEAPLCENGGGVPGSGRSVSRSEALEGPQLQT